MHDDVDELGDVRSGHERGHAGCAEFLWVDDAVGAGVGQLGDALVLAGAGDDEEVGLDRASRERHEQVLGVAFERGDQRSGALEAGARASVLSSVASPTTVGNGMSAVRSGIEVHDHDVVAGSVQIFGNGPADASPSAHDGVPAEFADLTVHESTPEEVAQLSVETNCMARVKVKSTVEAPMMMSKMVNHCRRRRSLRVRGSRRW